MTSAHTISHSLLAGPTTMQQCQPDIAFLDELIRTHEEHLGDNDRAFLILEYYF